MKPSYHYHADNGSEIVIEEWENAADGKRVFGYKIQHYITVEKEEIEK